jgi:hypothetical protein
MTDATFVACHEAQSANCVQTVSTSMLTLKGLIGIGHGAQQRKKSER